MARAISNESGVSVQCGWIQLESTCCRCVGRTERKGEIEGLWSKIPNTLRAQEATWKPDGSRIVLFDMEMVRTIFGPLIRMERIQPSIRILGMAHRCKVSIGLQRTRRTFGDGIISQSQAGTLSFELETTNGHSGQKNELDETDPYWGPDNRLWFASNKDGIFNVFYGYGG